MAESIEFFPSFPDQSSLDVRTETHQLWKIQKDHRQTIASCFFCKDLKCPFLWPAWVHKSYRKLRVGFEVCETSKDTSGAWIPQSLNSGGPTWSHDTPPWPPGPIALAPGSHSLFFQSLFWRQVHLMALPWVPRVVTPLYRCFIISAILPLSDDSLFPSLGFYPLSTLLWLFRPNSSSLLMFLCGHEIIVFYMDFNECTLHKKEMLLLQSGLFLHLK